MKYGRSRVTYTDKHLNLISFDKVFNRSGSADCKTNTLAKGCKNFDKGRPVSKETNGLTAEPENNKRS